MHHRIGFLPVVLAVALAGVALAQAPADQPGAAEGRVVSLALDADRIGLVLTAQGITTRMTFPYDVKEVICGDLYDSATGVGRFVVQRSGRDVFVKAIAPRGLSNLFVKTGDSRIFNFDLKIQPQAAANRLVVVTLVGADTPRRSTVEQIDQILRVAEGRAQRVIDDAAGDIEAAREEHRHLQQDETARKFNTAVLAGIHDAKGAPTPYSAGGVTLSLDKSVMTFAGKSFLRFTVQNNSDSDFTIDTVRLDSLTGATHSIAVETNLGPGGGHIPPGDARTGVLAFEPGDVVSRDRLRVSVVAGGATLAAGLNLAD